MTSKGSLTWLITGADKGLGFSTAKTALEKGDRVVVTVLASDGQHPLRAQYPEHFRAIHLDARDHHRVAAVAAEAESAFGGIDVLVNNAGYGLLAVAEECTPEQYRPLFEVNFFATAEMTRALLPGMRRRRSGHIVNLSSVAGFAGSGGFCFYSAAKFAVEGFSEALAKEVGTLGIHVTIIEPGAFRSDFAGPSLASALCTIDDYAPALGQRISNYVGSRHGHQPNDPALFGPALWEMAHSEMPPLRLPLGEDAVQIVRDKLSAVDAEVTRWEKLSRSTTLPA